MQVSLEGLAANIKRAMGRRDTAGWGYALDNIFGQFQKLLPMLEQHTRYDLGNGFSCSKRAEGWIVYWNHWEVSSSLVLIKTGKMPDEVEYFEKVHHALFYVEHLPPEDVERLKAGKLDPVHQR